MIPRILPFAEARDGNDVHFFRRQVAVSSGTDVMPTKSVDFFCSQCARFDRSVARLGRDDGREVRARVGLDRECRRVDAFDRAARTSMVFIGGTGGASAAPRKTLADDASKTARVRRRMTTPPQYLRRMDLAAWRLPTSALGPKKTAKSAPPAETTLPNSWQ